MDLKASHPQNCENVIKTKKKKKKKKNTAKGRTKSECRDHSAKQHRCIPCYPNFCNEEYV